MLNDDLRRPCSWQKQNLSAGRQDAHWGVAVSATGYRRAKTTTIDKGDTVPMHHLEKYYFLKTKCKKKQQKNKNKLELKKK